MEGTPASTVDRRDQLRSVGTSVGLTVAGFLTVLVVGLVGVTLLGFVGVDIAQQPVLANIFNTIALGVGFGLAVFTYVVLTDNWDLIGIRVPTLRELGLVVGGTALLIGSLLALQEIVSAIGLTPATNSIVTQSEQNPELVPYLIPLSIIFIGPGEELLFRGAIQGRLRQSYSAPLAIALSSLLFGAAHISATFGNPPSGIAVYVVVTFILGALLGGLYEYTNNLVVPSLVHGLYNAILFASLYVELTGGA